MGDFARAVKVLLLPICPHCGEMRSLEKLTAIRWLCVVCAKEFTVWQ